MFGIPSGHLAIAVPASTHPDPAQMCAAPDLASGQWNLLLGGTSAQTLACHRWSSTMSEHHTVCSAAATSSHSRSSTMQEEGSWWSV